MLSSVAQSCPTLCDSMNRSMPGLPVHHQLLEFTQTPVHRVSDAIPAISSSVVPFSSCPQSLPASESFPVSQLFAWGGQSTGVSALASALPKKSQGWSPSEWTGWISLQSYQIANIERKWFHFPYWLCVPYLFHWVSSVIILDFRKSLISVSRKSS